jgi:hypothetical protein
MGGVSSDHDAPASSGGYPTRRVAGVLLLAVAVLAAVVIGRIGGVDAAGTAVAPPGLIPPVVGQCLTQIDGLPDAVGAGASVAVPAQGDPASGDPRLGDLGSDDPALSAPAPTVDETSVRFSDCTGEHVGEVVGYRRMPTQSGGPAGRAAALAGTAVSGSSDSQWCGQVAVDYQGNAIFRYRDAAAGLWVPSTGQRFVTILGTPTGDVLQTRWAACAVVSPNLEAYSGLYMGSLAGGAAPAPFGTCRSDVDDAGVSCDDPHRSQVFGVAAAPGTPTRDAVAACRSLISLMTRMDDVTAGGRTVTEVVGGLTKESGEPIGYASCRLAIVGDAHLVGTLIGIADRPLPVS